jgi:transposase-like protein
MHNGRSDARVKLPRCQVVSQFTWTWTGIEADTKLIITWLVGSRDGEHAIAFMDDLRDRLANRVQLTTDGHKAYLEAVEGAFGGDVDYAILHKI